MAPLVSVNRRRLTPGGLSQRLPLRTKRWVVPSPSVNSTIWPRVWRTLLASTSTRSAILRGDRLVARSPLPRIRLHDLRHTHASILLRAGVNVKVVSERLGHANPAFTITVYQHIIPGMQADAATVFSDLVAGVLPPAVAISDVADDE